MGPRVSRVRTTAGQVRVARGQIQANRAIAREQTRTALQTSGFSNLRPTINQARISTFQTNQGIRRSVSPQWARGARQTVRSRYG